MNSTITQGLGSTELMTQGFAAGPAASGGHLIGGISTSDERSIMGLLALIATAETAKTADDAAGTVQSGHAAEAAAVAATDATAKTHTSTDLTSAAQAVHDYLTTNGSEVVVDITVTPPTVVEYTAVDPGSYLATPKKVAT